ncbi:MAG TPA: extracellular solute-binding protein [Desulfobacteraceae bacterium]|nr:extracellular solute-binding protein [Desulfobacteraceae bacterium]
MPEEPTETEAMEAEATPTEAEAAAGGEEVQGDLRVAVVRGAMIDTMRTLAGQFEERNPGVTVSVEEEPEGGAFEALIAAGNQPDIIVASFGPQIGRLAAQEAAVPLGNFPGAQELFDRLEPATVQQLYGEYYYVPVGADVTMMIYNKQLFEEAGLDPESPPETWDEFLQAAEAINNLETCEYGDRTYGGSVLERSAPVGRLVLEHASADVFERQPVSMPAVEPPGNRHRLRPARVPDGGILRLQQPGPGFRSTDHGTELL